MATAVPLPPNEPERLGRLRALGVLDSPPHAALDGLARVAAALCGVPIALVGLVDADRLWFKANVGWADRTALPRDVAPCAYTILGPDLLEVSDLAADPRFASNPLVTADPGLRFYAGAPLTMTDGSRVGTLSVWDWQPRSLTESQRHALVDLASAVSRELEASARAASLATEPTGPRGSDAHLSEARLAAIVRSSDDAIIGKTSEGIIVSWNSSATRIFGYSADEMIGRSITTLIPPELLGEEREFIETIRRGELVSHYETVRRRKDGTLVDISVSLSPITDAQGCLVGIAKVARDISQRKHMQRQLAEQHQLLQVTLSSIGDAVITTDVEGRVQWMNPVAERLTGWSQDVARHRHVTQVFNLIDEDSRAPAVDPVTVCVAENRIVALATHAVLVSRDGRERGIEDSAAPIRNADGRVLGGVLVFHDVSEQRRMSREMTFRATHDPLTGLVNRTEFEGRIQRLLQGDVHLPGGHALMFIDLDHFKLVNDSCGHSVGDLLLRQISALVARIVRAGDCLARLGGDEFGVLLERCSVEQAYRVAQQICDAMDDFRFAHGTRRFRLGASIGLVPVDQRWLDAAAVLHAADTACYAAKEAGRNRVHVWSVPAEQVTTSDNDAKWAGQLAQALDDDRIELYGQRIVPLTAIGTGLRVKVLLRLHSSDGTLVCPRTLVPAAERFHIATRLDRRVLQKVLGWMDADSRIESQVDLVAMNLSGQSVGDREFHRFVEGVLDGVSFDKRKLCFEITETSAITNLADASIFIERMRKRGVRVALDDFGAGASAFGYLKTMKVDYLKIDGQFIRDMVADPLDLAMVKCFHDIARGIGVETVAECVESEGTLAALRALGVDYGQGFLLHRPVPLEALMDRWSAPRA